MSPWFRSRSEPEREDPAVAPVERILAAAVSRCSGSVQLDSRRAVGFHALWICACVTADDAPVWLIYDLDDGGIVWQRLPDRVEPLDVVDARHIAGGHADPADVLAWLQGDAPDPWEGGDRSGDPLVIEELGRKIHSG